MNKEEVFAYNSIRNHRKLTDRELMEQVYELLVALHMKIDKLGLQKYKEMEIEDGDIWQFTRPFSDEFISKDDKTDNLEETLTDTKEFFQELFKVPED
ncbi:hypothetical protein CGC50_00125 [Capnocytophaga gingivalis]|uniref:Uncharacterized protein n=1 Tax=Capnocytophaga gingivalis TaxID=1017 RepID=A0A250FMV2_9FLAO|nr:hypothetical protein [Capnocytophaga gingivalis]ATA85695.1 hypothetical protein CGC50_00125 [Capnocytophaga gingivalis]